ncbi:HORMA domain containing 2 [Rhinolophus ferrumequinum]|uniref:HORMA domain containing 2 n=2 Tax=Rhinolophus TaxID=49442 RepID=A0A671EAH0_RHIFE|nr:HORMA domain-containing protein 2 isoform X1 [Rhinolophus ferrumequinum]XP_032953567.1 HORMA domain-containing protein 2 isoform X1 [Rhinolophus ferrumequinum]XP_032953569.1 HORMA domain-containing protein 2 isoform X1 [Rhinolophus ferrumequinum]XP_032953570.1 HORMA domain-containing protein 2 isoform X1 [Rhinolophus ferrumequinum]KAF6277975.1 HORMA domain containing 2 [Rhinolophus ferrumequinum]
MATAQLSHSIRSHKAPKETIFPSQITNEHESLIMVKKLFATSISCITYLRGLFPESSYGERHLDDLSLKILREDKKCPGSLHIIKWIQGCFDALEKRYLHMAILTLYTNPKEPEKVTEIYQFKFKYTKKGATMDFDSSNISFKSATNSEDIKKASVLLIRKLYILMQNLGPLPNDVILTMKLHYYNAVTPRDYQPPGFKEGINSHFLLFEGEPVNLQVGIVSTGFHSMKVKVTTEVTRVSDLENNLFQENSTTEIAHQGLDCDEEEEECNSQIQRMNLVHSQQSSESSKKKRKVGKPVKVFTPDRK